MCGTRFQDTEGKVRGSLLRALFSNYFVVLSFYVDYARRALSIPLVGRWLARPLLAEYALRVHGGMPLPLEEVLKVIERARCIVVNPCPCRRLHHRCNAPRMTCMKIDTAAEMLEDRPGAKRVSKKEAEEIIRDGFARGLVAQLEHCVAPYKYCICLCCRCCCVPMILRYDLGLKEAVITGPYKPEFDPERCTGCNLCAKDCPVGAILPGSPPELQEKICMGCGLCRDSCQDEALVMVENRSFRPLLEPHWASRLLWYALIIFFLVPQVFIYKFLWEREITSQVELS